MVLEMNIAFTLQNLYGLPLRVACLKSNRWDLFPLKTRINCPFNLSSEIIVSTADQGVFMRFGVLCYINALNAFLDGMNEVCLNL